MRDDVAMPRDLVRRRRSFGYAAVVVVGFEAEPTVHRIASVENVEGYISVLQPGRWEKLRFNRVLWTPGMAVARTIADNSERFLNNSGHGLGNHWFRVGLDVLDDLFRAEAISLRTRTWTPQELTIRLKRQSDAEADRFARGEI